MKVEIADLELARIKLDRIVGDHERNYRCGLTDRSLEQPRLERVSEWLAAEIEKQREEQDA